MSLDLDPRFTFDSYIVGMSNRLAAAAARRVADAPGAAYNPLFVYSASGLGKTHLINAVGNHIRRVHSDAVVVYDTLESLLEGVMESIHAGEADAFRSRLRHASVLLLDDVQFLAGRRSAQEELLRAWDGLSLRGGQIVLASDRPPQEIDGMDERLMSRFSGGLIADLDVPDYETRVAIVRRKAEERGQQLAEGVAETLAKIAFTNVRELQGGLNRVLAVQELDDRSVECEEVAHLLGVPAERRTTDEFSSFLSEIAGAVGDVVASVTPDQKLRDAIERWAREGYQTKRLAGAIGGPMSAEEIEALIAQHESAAARLSAVTGAIAELDPGAAELGRTEVLRNPDRLDEAEAILDQVRERMLPLPGPRDAPRFEALRLDPDLFAVRAARAVAQAPGDRYNPFFVHGPRGTGKTSLATSIALQFREEHDEPVAFMTGDEFSRELIGAIERNQVDSWRSRYRRARMMVIDGIDPLMHTERAQEELFHLFDTARRSGVQLVFTADTAPRDMSGFEDRLRTRLESGLVVDLRQVPRAAESPAPELDHATVQEIDEFFTNREKLIWQWPYLQDCMAQELE